MRRWGLVEPRSRPLPPARTRSGRRAFCALAARVRALDVGERAACQTDTPRTRHAARPGGPWLLPLPCTRAGPDRLYHPGPLDTSAPAYTVRVERTGLRSSLRAVPPAHPPAPSEIVHVCDDPGLPVTARSSFAGEERRSGRAGPETGGQRHRVTLAAQPLPWPCDPCFGREIHSCPAARRPRRSVLLPCGPLQVGRHCPPASAAAPRPTPLVPHAYCDLPRSGLLAPGWQGQTRARSTLPCRGVGRDACGGPGGRARGRGHGLKTPICSALAAPRSRPR